LRWIFVRLQGAPKGAYYLYVTFGATLKAGKKTSTIADLFVSEALNTWWWIPFLQLRQIKGI
jgi:hypothetical protein